MEKNELTFLIPTRIDSADRIENIISVVSFLFQNGFQNIRISEGSSFYNGILEKLFGQEIHYTFIEDYNPVFHRTRDINRMVTEATTPYVAVWDTDVVIAPEQVRQATKLLISGQADFVIPYEKQALDTTPIIRKLFMEDGNIKTLELNRKKMKEMYAPNPLGGAFMVNREAYIKAGMENEDFYGWGMENIERFYRWKSMGYKIKWVPGPLYHLTHGRGINSKYHNPDQGLWKRKETLKAKRLAGYGQDELE
jgi:hypothetical protein